tara:strand:- start:4494 stop:4826 length:333 start_codon:yes stop_codon:yes gene_type:complete
LTTKNIIIFLLIGVISWLIIFNIGEDEISETTIQTLKDQNGVLLSKQKESALKLDSVALKLKVSDKVISEHQQIVQVNQIIYHEKIDSVRTFNKSEAYRFLTDRYFGSNP